MKYLFYSALLVFVIMSLGICQENQVDLKETRITIKMERQPLGVVFEYLMEKYDIPIGFEESTLDRSIPDYVFHANLPGRPRKRIQRGFADALGVERVFGFRLHPITVKAEDESLEQVFDQIVGQMENYKWEISDGVVNIFPVKGRDERFEKLMGQNIQRFTFEKGQTVGDITKNIRALPEFNRFLKENKFIFTGTRYGPTLILNAQYGREINVEMDISNLTFRDLLNKITKIKRGGWVLRWKRPVEGGVWEYIDLDI